MVVFTAKHVWLPEGNMVISSACDDQFEMTNWHKSYFSNASNPNLCWWISSKSPSNKWFPICDCPVCYFVAPLRPWNMPGSRSRSCPTAACCVPQTRTWSSVWASILFTGGTESICAWTYAYDYMNSCMCIYIYTLVFLLIYKNEYSKNKCHTLKTPDISLKPGISHTLFKRGRFLGIQPCQPIPPLLQGAMSWMGTTSWRRGHRWIGGKFRGYSWSNHSIAESKHICQMGRYV